MIDIVATVNIEIWKGGSAGVPGTETNVDALGPPNVRFHTSDAPDAIDTTNPIPIPTSGQNNSFWVHVAVQFGGTFTQLSNFRHYSDGAIGWTFGTIPTTPRVPQLARGKRDTGDNGCPKANYAVATGTVGTTGDDMAGDTLGHSFYRLQATETVNINSDTSGAPATIDTTTYTVAGDTKAIVMQVNVGTDATQGDQGNETLTWLYDEI